MSFTVYSSLQNPETGEDVVSEFRNYADLDEAAAAKDDLHESLDDGTAWVTTWIEDEHGNVLHYSDDRDNWNDMLDDIFTEDPGY